MRKKRTYDSEPALDDIDRQLITLLQEEGRATDVDLAARLGISNDTARRRRTRLERSGVIKIKAHLNPRRFGYVHYIHLYVTTKPKVGTRSFAERISRERNAYYVALTIGPEQRVLIHYRGKTEDAVYDFVERLRKDPQVEHVEAHAVHEVVKVSFHSLDLESE